MIRRNFIKTALLGTGISLFPKFLMANSVKELPNIMLIGDSVSLGYTKYVKAKLEGKVNFFRPLNAKGGYVNCA